MGETDRVEYFHPTALARSLKIRRIRILLFGELNFYWSADKKNWIRKDDFPCLESSRSAEATTSAAPVSELSVGVVSERGRRILPAPQLPRLGSQMDPGLS